MQSIFYVIGDAGDGSNFVEWYRTREAYEKLVDLCHAGNYGEWDQYASGDGLQGYELKFPDNFDLKEFAKVNLIFWKEDEDVEEDEND